MMKKTLAIIFICFIVLFSLARVGNADTQTTNNNPKVLYINSYHQGYKWSDDIFGGIKSQLAFSGQSIDLDVEYMDTQRITNPDYLQSLVDFYQYKYQDKQYDIIICSDDLAYTVLVEQKSTLFPNTPIIFCGVNHFDPSIIDNHPLITGVVESYSIGDTLQTALTLHPQLSKVYYIDDNTITGQAIYKEFEKVMLEYKNQLEFVRLDGKTFDDILSSVQDLPNDSIILFLIYFKDNSGKIFSYDESIQLLEQSSSVPIYGVWDFHLGHGIVGGALTSGYDQGQAVAKIALDVLSGISPADIPVQTEKINHYKFDYHQLQKHNIPLAKLPKGSVIINHDTSKKAKILVLNSYHKGMQWTDDIERGIKDALATELDSVAFTYEYMDLKNNPGPIYLYNIKQFLLKKYENSSFDLIVTTDDDAFQFVSQYIPSFFHNTPLIFCGVNYLDDALLNGKNNITGVLESIDLEGTLDLALSLHPNTKRIIVINDTTLTGESNLKRLNGLIPKYSGTIDFNFWSNVNMTDIQEMVNLLNKDDLILLLTFNRDKSYNHYTYDESIELISKNTTVPIYGVWDFYMGKGLTGGNLTSGYVQGQSAGALMLQVLDGTSPQDIPILSNNLTRYMFDYKKLKKFNVKLSSLPKDSIIINRPFSLKALYINNTKIFVIISLLVFFILILFGLISLLIRNIHIKKLASEKARIYAMTDSLTGVYNRRACFDYLNQLVENRSEETPFSVAFVDADGLKNVNDTFGHTEGDLLIMTICQCIKNNIKASDQLCRLGGDEFLIVLDNANITSAQQIWKRIQAEIDAYNAKQAKPYTISASVGLVEYTPAKHASIDTLIDEADKKMYAAKQSHYTHR